MSNFCLSHEFETTHYEYTKQPVLLEANTDETCKQCFALVERAQNLNVSELAKTNISKKIDDLKCAELCRTPATKLGGYVNTNCDWWDFKCKLTKKAAKVRIPKAAAKPASKGLKPVGAWIKSWGLKSGNSNDGRR